jgi:hypothetical protein
MRKWILGFWFLFLLLSSGICMAESGTQMSAVVSKGVVYIVDPVGHYVMIQKSDGKKVSLELTSESEVIFNGEPLSLDRLEVLKPGDMATAEHFTNDAGMQRTIRLTVQEKVEP